MRRLVVLSLLGLAACAEERPRPSDACQTWQDDVAPVVAATCVGCHGADAPGGSYDLRTYLGALGPGSDPTANAIAGDPTSAIVTTIDPATATGPHAGLGAAFAVIEPWVADCALAYFDSPLHPGGILDPASPGFHGRELATRDWDFALCGECHDNLLAPTAAPSCTTCHAQGPTACDTCHAAQPATNAHPTHLAAGLSCEGCHQVPAAWNTEGHILVDGVADPAPAEVVFTGLATTSTPDRTAPPSYAPTTGTCAQVYCHGDVLGGAGGTNSQPAWPTDPPGPAACTSCHGQPPPGHVAALTQCAQCHPSGSQHLDGVVDVGTGGTGCSGCHGSAASSAPPRDLSGQTLTTAIGVGAHQAHLTGPHRLSGPVACAACHVVPATTSAPGHLDTVGPAEVLPSLGWDRTSQTCATATCHGPARPIWTSTANGEVACGTCHGVPPASAAHSLPMPLTMCATCHPRTVDGFGNIKITDGPSGPTSTHINGAVDAP